MKRFDIWLYVVGACFLSMVAGPSYADEDIFLTFGDSITEHNVYQPPLEKLLNSASRPSRIVNKGVIGENTVDGLRRLNGLLPYYYGQHVLLLEGINDPYDGLSLGTTITNLDQMLKNSLAKNVEPIISTLTPVDKNRVNRNPEAYNPDIKKIAAARNVKLCDQYAVLVDNWVSDYTWDGLHPNSYGGTIMAQAWFKSIVGKTTGFLPAVLELILQ